MTHTSLLLTELKLVKQRKGEIARRFKSLEPGSPEHQQAIVAMQAVTQEIKDIESRIADENQAAKEVQQPTLAPPSLTLIDASAVNTEQFSCRLLADQEWAIWDAYVANVAATNAYQYAVWLHIIQEQFGHQGIIWAAFDEQSRIIGGIPLAILDSRIFGRYAVSMPYFNYGGVLSEFYNVAQVLLQSVEALCAQLNLQHIEVRCMQAGLLPIAQCVSKKSSMILALPNGQAQLDQQLGAKVRAQYKKALDHNPQIEFGKIELLDAFYTVFAQNMRDLGTPVYAKSWFARLLEEPSLNCHLAIVRMYGKPVSAGFLIGHGNMLEIPWASTLRKANGWNANMWMYRQILGFAIDQGYQYFDFGRSTVDAGTYKFKRQWGAEPFAHYWYYLMPPGGVIPSINPDNPKYALAINIWKRLPVWLTKIIGPPIVANLP